MQIDLQTENVAKLIQLALGPVFLLSGVGITLSMLTQRLSRIVDRARKLEDEHETTGSEQKRARIDTDLKVIFRRTRYINGAIALCIMSPAMPSGPESCSGLMPNRSANPSRKSPLSARLWIV